MRRIRSPRLVGRDEETDRIRQSLAEAQAGRGGFTFLVGEAGSGKTRLMDEAIEEARRRKMAVLASSSPSIVAPLPFGVLADAFRSWLRSTQPDRDALRPFAAGIHHILPEWPLDGPSPQLTPDQTRLLVLEGAVRLLLSAGSENGAVFLIDDLHSADPETAQFLRYAAAIIPDEKVLLLASIRQPEGRSLEAELRALEQRDLASGIEVQPLSPEKTGELIEAIFGAQGPPALVGELMARTDGIPLLVEEVLDAYFTEGDLRFQGSGLLWSPSGSGIPHTILEMVGLKLNSLSEPGRTVVAAAALLERFHEDMFLRVTELNGAILNAGLREALDTGLLEATPGSVAFRHALIRESVERCLLVTERQDLHRRAAKAIADLFGDDPQHTEERARHLEGCGERDGSAALLVDLARQSLASQGPASAEVALRRAISLARSEYVRREARDLLAETLGVLGRWDESLRVDLDLSRQFGDTPVRLTRMARTAISAGRLDQADSLIERASKAGASSGALSALSGLAALWRGDLEVAINASRNALTLAKEVHDSDLACQAYDVFGRALDATGRREEAAAAFDGWIEAASAAGLTASHLQALMERGNLDFLSGGPSGRLDEARSLARECGAYLTYVLASLSLVWWHGRRDRIEDAPTLAHGAVEACRHFSLDLLPHALAAAGWAHNLKRCGDGEPFIAEALSLAPDDHDLQVICGWARGEAYLRAGDIAHACEQLRATTEIMSKNPTSPPTPAPFQLPVALLLSGERQEAAAAAAAARNSLALPVQYVNRFWLDVSESLLAGSAINFEAAIAPFRSNAIYDYGCSLLLAAQLLSDQKRQTWLSEALRIFHEIGAETEQERARTMMRLNGVPLSRGRSRTAARLPSFLRDRGVTVREAEVLELIGRGLTNRQIGERLFISVRTVETHVSALIQKLEVEGRPGLIALSLAEGNQTGPFRAE